MEDRRLAAAHDLRNGMTQADVARTYHVHPSNASRWARTLRTEGVDGLRLKKARGAAPKLTPKQKERLARILDEGPAAHGWTTQVWTSRRVAEVVRREFGTRYHRNHVPRLLYALGFRPRKPQREAHEKDPARKAEWIATTWVRLKKT